MLPTITVSQPIYERLNEEAQRANLTPNQLAEQWLGEHLVTPDWRTQFETLLSQVEVRMHGFDSAEIEADITAAYEEVKANRRARRSA